MLIQVTRNDATIAGSVWPKGTRLECPDVEAKRAISAGEAAPADAAPAPAKKKAPAPAPAPEAPVGLAAPKKKAKSRK